MTEPRLRVYVDTSVIGGCLDKEFELPSRRLFARFRAGDFVLVLSDVTVTELGNAPSAVRDVLRQLPVESIERWPLTPEAERLAETYLEQGVIPKRIWSDAQHIAVATLAGVDVLVSWNFKHIVNFQRIRGYNAVNAKLGYPPVEIRTPQEVGANED
jgi:predicted nucleic acid-binding protein